MRNNPTALTDPTGLYYTCDGIFAYDQVDFQVDGQAAGSDRVLIGPCISQTLQPWLNPPGIPDIGGGGGGGGGGDSSSNGNMLDVPSLQKAAIENSVQACTQAYENSIAGKVLAFGSIASLVPGINSDWQSNMQEWATFLTAKIVTFKGLGEAPINLTSVTGTATKTIPEAIPGYGSVAGKAVGKLGTVGMALATAIDIAARDGCRIANDPNSMTAFTLNPRREGQVRV